MGTGIRGLLARGIHDRRHEVGAGARRRVTGYRFRVLGRRNGYLAAWLRVLLAGQVVAFAAVWGFFVHTQHGQLLDMIALSGDAIGRATSAEWSTRY